MPFNLPVSMPDSGYKIARSLRFNSVDQAYLNRTPVGPATSRRKFSLRFWGKRSALGSNNVLFWSGTVNTNDTGALFNPNDTILFFHREAGVMQGDITTTAVFRDPSAHMEILFVYDTDNATAANRLQIWVNGVRQTVTTGATLPVAKDAFWNHTVLNTIGASTAPSLYFGGYLSDIHNIDGLALDPSAFGQADPTTGVWMPKAYTGLYGTNGFKLDFADNSAVTAATLGKDRSGMSNLITYSDAFNNPSGWAVAANGVFTAGQADPLGGTGAVHFAIGASTANPYFYAGFTPVVGQTTTLTIYAKAGVFTQISVYNGNLNGGQGYFDLTAGSLISSPNAGTGTGTVAKIEPVAGQPGWYKCSVTTTHQTAAGDSVLIQLIGPSTTNGQGLTVFRADRTLGSTTPAELQYTNGAAVPDKNWTPNAFSVTAGAGNDSLVDTPTNYGLPDANGGGVVRGNYCTLNPLDTMTAALIVLGDGNLFASGTLNGAWGTSRGTMWVNSGKWYWEALVGVAGTGSSILGILGPSYTLAGRASDLHAGVPPDGYAYFSSALKFNNGVNSAYGASFGNLDVIGMALDLDVGTITAYKNGVSQGVMYSGLSGNFAPAFSPHKGDNSSSFSVNFGQRPFAFAAPAGFKALCTQNLSPAPTPALPANFTGNGLADGPFVYAKGVVQTVTINGNVATRGTHFDGLSNGIKLRTNLAAYNTAGANTITAATYGASFKYARGQGNP